MKYDCFIKDTVFGNWLTLKGFDRWRIANYRGKNIFLLYQKNKPCGFAISANSRIMGRGYDVLVDIKGLPITKYEICKENNTMAFLLNADEFKEKGIIVAKILDAYNRKSKKKKS